MAMLREFCNVPAHLHYPATPTADARNICPVCAGSRVTFEQWTELVDAAVGRQLGVSVHDLPDIPFQDWFNEGFTPGEVAVMVEEDAA